MTTSKEPKPHGGARKGAGRKARSHALQAVTFKIEPTIAERFRRLAHSHDRSQAKQFAEMVKNARMNLNNKIPMNGKTQTEES